MTDPVIPDAHHPARPSSLQELRSGIQDIAPLAFGVAIYGVAFGLLAGQARMDEVLTGTMGLLVFAGSSQIVATQRLVAGAGVMVAVVAGLALNMRLLLMTAALRDELSGRPLWQVLLGVHLTTDENWALMHTTRTMGRPAGYWYLVGGGATLLVVWVIATVFGVRFAHALPDPGFHRHGFRLHRRVHCYPAQPLARHGRFLALDRLGSRRGCPGAAGADRSVMGAHLRRRRRRTSGRRAWPWVTKGRVTNGA